MMVERRAEIMLQGYWSKLIGLLKTTWLQMVMVTQILSCLVGHNSAMSTQTAKQDAIQNLKSITKEVGMYECVKGNP